jgi:ribonucleoside-diphosphate reductase beta chain
MHWVPEEVPLADDVKDWTYKLTVEEKNLVTHIFRFFTQGDVEVMDNYMVRYMTVFRPPEVQMMLAAFANMEGIHVEAYSLLLDTLGLPEVEYSKFLEYKAMRDKHDLFETFSVDNPREVAKTLAGFGGFVEGVQLFASFAILINFTRFNKMNGMGKVIEWSMRDENLHSEGITWLFRTYVKENRGIWDDSLKREIYAIAERMVETEDAFIDLAFEMGGIEGLTPEDVKTYVRYMADKRLIGLGMKGIFKQKTHPLGWIDVLTGATKSNFFESRETGYSKGVTKGTWDQAFAEVFPNT